MYGRLMVRVVIVLVALAGIACESKKVSFHRLELPGFTVEVPRTLTFGGDLREDYAAGSIKAQSRKPPYVAGVSWQTGELSTVDELRQLAAVIASGIDAGKMTIAPGIARRTEVAGQAAVEIDITFGGAPMTLLEVECGVRTVQLMAWSMKGSREIAERMRATFRCAPVAELEVAGGTGAPVGFDRPDDTLAGWARMPSDVGQLALTDEASVVMFTRVADVRAVTPDALDRMIVGMMAIGDVEWKPEGRERRDGPHGARELWRGVMTSEGESLPAVFTLWPCDGLGGNMAIAMIFDEDRRAAALDLVMAARCPRPDDAPLAVPAAPDDDAP